MAIITDTLHIQMKSSIEGATALHEAFDSHDIMQGGNEYMNGSYILDISTANRDLVEGYEPSGSYLSLSWTINVTVIIRQLGDSSTCKTNLYKLDSDIRSALYSTFIPSTDFVIEYRSTTAPKRLTGAQSDYVMISSVYTTDAIVEQINTQMITASDIG